jgi:hypothetical protein
MKIKPKQQQLHAIYQVQLRPQLFANHPPTHSNNLLKPNVSLTHTLHAIPSSTPTSSTVWPTTAQQVPTYTLMTHEAGKAGSQLP